MTDFLYLLLVVMLVMPGKSSAQDSLSEEETGEHIYMICNVKDDQLELRWAPESWQLFKLAMEQGFTLTKLAVQGKDSIITDTQFEIPSQPIFRDYQNAYNDFAAAYHLLYEEIQNSAGILGNFSAFEVGATRYGMLLFLADLNFSLAEYLKLAWIDKDYNPAHINIYSIRINGSEVSATLLGGFGCIGTPMAIGNVYSFPEDHSISISWDPEQDRSGYVGFDIERSEDRVAWIQLNTQPIAVVEQGNIFNQELLIFKDSVAENFKNYFYRIRGINSFGNYGPYSEPIEAEARPRINIGLPYITRAANVGDTSIDLEWNLEGEDIDQVENLVILRAEHPDSLFQILDTLDAAEREYLDRNALQLNYYFIRAYDRDRRIYVGPIAHWQLPDKKPPLPPKNVIARIDSSGKVTIDWSPNSEPDLIGYRVFYKRYWEDEIIQLTTGSIKDTSYVHALPLNMLHDRGYYMVRAEDQVGNRSEDSEFREVIVPDTISPSSPTIISTRSEIYGCILNISLSGSSDVVSHVVQRRNLHDTLWQDQVVPIDPLILFQQEIFDSTLAVGQEVQYRIIARDDSGNESVSNIAEGRRIDNKIRPKPEQPTVSWDRKKKELIFSWLYPFHNDLQAVRIFKSSATNIRFYTDQYIYTQDLEIVNSKSDLKRFVYRMAMADREEEFIYKIRLDFNDGATSEVADFSIN